MIRVLLVHSGQLPHYRIGVYSYLHESLSRAGFDLSIISDGIQVNSNASVDFPYTVTSLSARSISGYVIRNQVQVVIYFVDMRHRYLFPSYFHIKGILRRKTIYWGQGRDLMDRNAKLKNLAFMAEQGICDAIILYADHLKKYVPRVFHRKLFVANNSQLMIDSDYSITNPKEIRQKWGIKTTKNIICVGRIQKRKRLGQLVEAFRLLSSPDVGLILVGPDPEDLLVEYNDDRIYRLGAVYGRDKADLLRVANVYCLPGAVGLSIVDAFHFGLPLVTEDGDESAEIGYLRHGENGFMVPRGDVYELAAKLRLLLEDEHLRQRFSEEARREAATNAHIDRMVEGFRAALEFVTRESGRTASEAVSIV